MWRSSTRMWTIGLFHSTFKTRNQTKEKTHWQLLYPKGLVLMANSYNASFFFTNRLSVFFFKACFKIRYWFIYANNFCSSSYCKRILFYISMKINNGLYIFVIVILLSQYAMFILYDTVIIKYISKQFPVRN